MHIICIVTPSQSNTALSLLWSGVTLMSLSAHCHHQSPAPRGRGDVIAAGWGYTGHTEGVRAGLGSQRAECNISIRLSSGKYTSYQLFLGFKLWDAHILNHTTILKKCFVLVQLLVRGWRIVRCISARRPSSVEFIGQGLKPWTKRLLLNFWQIKCFTAGPYVNNATVSKCFGVCKHTSYQITVFSLWQRRYKSYDCNIYLQYGNLTEQSFVSCWICIFSTFFWLQVWFFVSHNFLVQQNS